MSPRLAAARISCGVRCIAAARDRGLGVVITHDPHHAHPVGDRFVVLERGRSVCDLPEAELPRDELVGLVAGGAELSALERELSGAQEADDGQAATAGGGPPVAHGA